MRDLYLIKLARDFYQKGIKDEEFIMKAIETTLGRYLRKSNEKRRY